MTSTRSGDTINYISYPPTPDTAMRNRECSFTGDKFLLVYMIAVDNIKYTNSTTQENKSRERGVVRVYSPAMK